MPNDRYDILRSMLQNLGISVPVRRSGPSLFEDYEAEREASGKDPAARGKGKAIIYTLTIECVAGARLVEPCQRVIEVKSNTTLCGLHGIIQQAVEFDDDHCFEFFIGPNYRARKIIFSDADDALEEFAEIELSQIWPLPKGMHLFYWFDFGDDWKFRIKKARGTKVPVKGTRYPILVDEKGPNPSQYSDEEE